MIDWLNFFGWLGALTFLALLGLYIAEKARQGK
jgi:hypothetical protein